MKAGKVYLAHDLVMKWLQLEGGNIRDARFIFERDAIELTIEHPEMPLVIPGSCVETVNLSFTRYQDNAGHSVAIRNPIQSRG